MRCIHGADPDIAADAHREPAVGGVRGVSGADQGGVSRRDSDELGDGEEQGGEHRICEA